MALKEPESMQECIYFTNRELPNGHVKCWVLKEKCPKCKKAFMGKPIGDKGKVKIRATEYCCPECGHAVPKQEYEDTLTASIKYKCPYCGYEDETQVPYKRKKIKIFDEEDQKERAAEAIQFECSKCKKKINITKKLK